MAAGCRQTAFFLCTEARTNKSAHARAHTHTHTRTRTRTHARTHAHTHTHMVATTTPSVGPQKRTALHHASAGATTRTQASTACGMLVVTKCGIHVRTAAPGCTPFGLCHRQSRPRFAAARECGRHWYGSGWCWRRCSSGSDRNRRWSTATVRHGPSPLGERAGAEGGRMLSRRGCAAGERSLSASVATC